MPKLSFVAIATPRDLTREERTGVSEAANAGKTAEIPKVGTFRPFSVEGRRLAIWSGFLMEERYALATRVLRRLGDRWHPGENYSLEGEEDVRE